MPKTNPSHTLTLPHVFSVLDSLSSSFIHCQSRSQWVVLDSWHPLCHLLPSHLIDILPRLPAFSLLLFPGLGLSLSPPGHCNGSLTSFLASDFGFIHLYITVFPYVMLSSNFSSLYLMMSFRSSLTSQSKF